MARQAEEEQLALTFVAGGDRLAIGAASVAEVLRTPALRRVPLAPEGLAGVANVRGAVLPVLSLARLLGEQVGDEKAARVIVTTGDEPVGLLVDSISALVPMRKLDTGADPARFLDLDALLEAEFGALRRRERGIAIAAPTATVAASRTEHAFLSFEAGQQEFALPLDQVGEVVALPDRLALLPDGDAAMLGVVAFRERLLPLLSLPVLLGFGQSPTGRDSRVVVATLAGIRLGLVVDRVRNIVRASDAQIDPVPLVLTRGRQEARIQAICRLDGGRRLVSILSTDHLLEPALVERLASARIEEMELSEAVAVATEQFVIFQLGDENYGIPIGSVEEVIRAPDRLTRLPKAPAFVAGVLNVRGRVIPVIDQRARFGTSSSGTGKDRIIILRIGVNEAGFLVDAVSEVLRVPVDRLRSTPALASRSSKVIDRIANFELDGKMYLLVDPQELLDRAEQDMLAGLGRDLSAPS